MLNPCETLSPDRSVGQIGSRRSAAPRPRKGKDDSSRTSLSPYVKKSIAAIVARTSEDQVFGAKEIPSILTQNETLISEPQHLIIG